MVLRHHSLWSVKMFLDLWNFWCLILASKVLLALTVQQLHLPTRAATLRVSLLPKCLANNISFSVKHVHQEVKSRSWDLVKCSRLKCIVQWCRHAYCVSLFSAFIELSCTASCCHGRRSASSPQSQSSQGLSAKALWERWFRLCTSWWWHKSCVSFFGFFYNPFCIGF